MPKSPIREIITIVLTALVFSCATGQLSSVQQDLEAKEFFVPSNTDKGRVYVIRPLGAFVGAIVLTNIIVDGRIVAAVGPKNFFVLDVNMGDHIFTALSCPKKLKVNIAPAKVYFIEVQHISGTMTLLSEEEGRRLVLDSKRIEPYF